MTIPTPVSETLLPLALSALNSANDALTAEAENRGDIDEDYEANIGPTLNKVRSAIEAIAAWNRRALSIPHHGNRVTDEQVEKAAIGLFRFDYPEDRWERFGQKDYHPEKYRAKARAALSTLEQPDSGEGEVVAWRVDRYGNDGSFIYSEVHLKKPDIRSACRTDFIPLYAAPSPAMVVTDAARDVVVERQRQVETEGWTQEHDDEHDRGEMAAAAGVYALAAGSHDYRWVLKGLPGNDYLAAALRLWPWDSAWFKPTDRRRDLVKAGALILAEIERLDRAALKSSVSDKGER